MCTQSIDTDFKSSKLVNNETALAKIDMDYQEAQQIANKLTKRLDAARQAQTHLQAVEVKRKQIEERIKSLTTDTNRLVAERDRTFDAPPPPPTEIGDLDAAQEAVNRLVYQKQVQEHANALLKDTGIRTRIIQQYLPIINRNINQYLSALNFPVQFTLNEQFEETIKSRHRDVFSYENFSEGEKRRIDLALVLTWRAIARMKNSVYTNLLIFDEIFDSSLDLAGTEDFLTLLHTLGTDTNTFVISHKTDALIDKFPHVISVTKEKGFSIVKAL
jgi:DNA repair exonuclease SbcCD ATPase subunit